MVIKLNVKLISGMFMPDEKVAREMEVAGSLTLEDLCADILKSLDFDFDHMYEFVVHGESYIGAPPYANTKDRCRVKLFNLGLKKGEKFRLEYDFGDSWIFEIKVKDISDAKGGPTRVTASIGSVDQYPNWEDWDEDEDDLWDEDPDDFDDDLDDELWDDDLDEDELDALFDDFDDWDEDFDEDGDNPMKMKELTWIYAPQERLFEAAYRYKKTKLWKQLFEGQIFALRFRDGQIGYISIMGNAGEHCAIGIYVGLKALDTMRRLSLDIDSNVWYTEMERVLQQDGLQVILENKEYLYPGEIEAAQMYAASRGMRLAGKNAFAHFQLFQPNHLPWHPTSKEQEQYLWEATEAAIYVADCLKTKTVYELGLVEISETACKVPLLVWENDSLRWDGYEDIPELATIQFPTPADVDEELIGKLKKQKGKGILECRVACFPAPVQNDMEAPHLPMGLFAVRSKDGYALPPQMVNDFEENPEGLLNGFLACLEENKWKPTTIRVMDERTEALLRNAAEKIGIRLDKRIELPALDGMLTALFSDGLGYDEPVAEWEMLIDMAEQIVAMPDAAIREMPRELKADFREILAADLLPDDLAEKLRKKLKL